MVELVNASIPWLVFGVPFIGALLIPLVSKAGDQIRNYIAVAITFISAAFALMMIPLALAGETLHNQVPWIPSLGITAGVLADPLSVLMANVVAWISLAIMVYSLGYMKGDPNLTRYWFFMIFFIGSMQLIVLSDNFLQLFFGWEGVGLASYALIGFWNKDKESDYVGTVGHKAWGIPTAFSPSHAGMKAFVMTRVGDVSFLIGIFVLYFFAGTFDFTLLAQEHGWAVDLARSGLLIPVAVLIFGGAIGKSAQFPLQEWLPDAMAGPTSVSALIHAATMVNAGVFLVARIGPLFATAVQAANMIAPFFETIAWIGVFTAFLAASQAMVAKEVKKVLAYSTVSQIGFMMLALGVAGLSANFLSGFIAGFFHFTSHAIFKAALFMGAGALIHATHTKYMSEMGGLRKEMRFTFIAMTIAAGSLAGIPLLSGFWSKDAILASILDVSSFGLAMPLFALATITAVMTAFYSARMIGMIFFGKKSQHLEEMEKEGKHVHEASRLMWLPYMALAGVTVLLGFTGPFFEGFLDFSFASHLEQAFGMVVIEAPFSINLVALAASLGALAVGGFFGYSFYISRRYDPGKILGSSGFLKSIHTFLENRWYINSIYYIIFVNGTLRVATFLHKRVEIAILNKINSSVTDSTQYFSSISGKFDMYIVDGVVTGIASISLVLSKLLRKIQTGITEQYVFAFSIGIIFLVILMSILLL